jgi:ribosomal protein L9
MTQQSTSLLVGLLAGISAAFLLVSAGSPSSLSFILFAAAALPVLIAGLGWSNLASIVAVLSAMAVIGIATTPQAALVSAVTTLAPAAWIAHLSNLARPAEEIGGPEGAVVWYPLPEIFVRIALCVCIGLVAVGVAMGYGADFVDQLVDIFVATIKESNAAYSPSPEGIAEMKQFFLYALPAIQAAMWVTILLAGWYVASAIVRMSGRSKRPKDDIPSQLRMPRTAAIALAVGGAMSFVDGGHRPDRLDHLRRIRDGLHHRRLRHRPSPHPRQAGARTAFVGGLSLDGPLYRAVGVFPVPRAVRHGPHSHGDRLRSQLQNLTTPRKDTTMDVILLERIAKLGQMGETVKVRDGYARNFLLPQGKALRANAANKARFEAERSVLEARNLERKAEAEQIAEKLDGKTFVVVRSAGETGQLYGSVAARDVIAVLADNGFSIGRSQVDMNNPVKTIGLHTVPLALHAEVNVTVTFNVARSADEAERQLKGEDLSSADAIYGIDEEAAAEAAEAAANDPDYLDDEDGEGEENA